MKMYFFIFMKIYLFFQCCITSSKAQEIDNGLLYRFTFTNGNFNNEINPILNGTNMGAIMCNDRNGNPKSAYHFDYSYITFNPNIQKLTDTYSFAMWAKPERLPTGGSDAKILLSIGGVAGDQAVGIYNNYLVDGRTGFGVNTYTGQGTDIAGHSSFSTQILPELNKWYFVVVIRTSDYLKIYINARLVVHKTFVNQPIYYSNSIGKIGSRYNGDQAFSGDIDDIRIYNRPLTACEINILYTQNPLTQTTPTNTCNKPNDEENLSSQAQTANEPARFEAYPNPLDYKNTIILESSNKNIKKANVILYNMQGKMLFTQNITFGEAFYLPENLMSGTYMLDVQTDKHQQKIRIVKQ